MGTMIAYKLKFKSPLHIGSLGVGYEETDEIIHSDTIFSAIMSLWHNFYDDEIEEICKNPPFIISSAFPFKTKTYFFPRPMVKIGREGEDDPQTGRKLKGVKYISKDLLETLLVGNDLEFDETKTLQKGKFWFAAGRDELDQDAIIFGEREVPRVTIDRASNASDIFYFSEIVFEKDSGLFFLANFLKEEMREKFEAVLSLVGDEGIGGDKRLGKGLFTVKTEEGFQISTPQDGNGVINLSLYHPKQEEIASGMLEGASYNLITRKGWIHSIGAMSLRRRSVRMFQEGSVFNSLGKEHYGDCPLVLGENINIGLSHNVYRYGLGFCLPIKRRGEDG